MKLFRNTLIILSALACASMFPSCGGSPENTGDQFVPVSAFKSGSAGFYILGSPVVRIRSNGSPNDVSPGSNPFPQIGRLDDFTDLAVGGGNTEEEWQNFAGNQSDVTKGDQSCIANVSIYNSTDNQYSIDGSATYVVSGQMGYMELVFNEVSGAGNNLEYAALIHFMGAVTRSDLTYSSDGDRTDSSGATEAVDNRVIITSLTGSTIKFWFNFETNQCMTELNYVAQTKYTVVGSGEASGASGTTPPAMRGVWRITHPFLRLNY